MKNIQYQSLFILILSILVSFSNQVQAEPVGQSPETTNRVIVRGGTIVDVRTGSLQSNATIVMENDRIVDVSGAEYLPEANETVIDATGQYILPGLIDAHVHYEDFAPELFLNHGLTTVLDLGNDYEWIKATSEAIEEGWIPGPRLYYSTPHFDASPPDGSPLLAQRGHKHYVDTVAEAWEAMTEYLAQGISAVKIYEKLGPDVLSTITRMADRANIPVIGHYLDAQTTIATSGTGIEHLYAIVRSAQDEETAQIIRELNEQRPGSLGIGIVASVDWDMVPSVIDELIEHNIYLNPTLMIYRSVPYFKNKGFQYEDFELLFNDWRLRYIPLQFRLHILKEYQEQGV